MTSPPQAPNLPIDPITLEVLRNALKSTADEMGAVLKRAALRSMARITAAQRRRNGNGLTFGDLC